MGTNLSKINKYKHVNTRTNAIPIILDIFSENNFEIYLTNFKRKSNKKFALEITQQN